MSAECTLFFQCCTGLLSLSLSFILLLFHSQFLNNLLSACFAYNFKIFYEFSLAAKLFAVKCVYSTRMCVFEYVNSTHKHTRTQTHSKPECSNCLGQQKGHLRAQRHSKIVPHVVAVTFLLKFNLCLWNTETQIQKHKYINNASQSHVSRVAPALESKSKSESKSITWLGESALQSTEAATRQQRETVERKETNRNETRKTKYEKYERKQKPISILEAWQQTTFSRWDPLDLFWLPEPEREGERERETGQHLSRGFIALEDIAHGALAMEEDLRYDSQIYWLLQCGTLARAARGPISHPSLQLPSSSPCASSTPNLTPPPPPPPAAALSTLPAHMQLCKSAL